MGFFLAIPVICVIMDSSLAGPPRADWEGQVGRAAGWPRAGKEQDHAMRQTQVLVAFLEGEVEGYKAVKLLSTGQTLMGWRQDGNRAGWKRLAWKEADGTVVAVAGVGGCTRMVGMLADMTRVAGIPCRILHAG